MAKDPFLTSAIEQARKSLSEGGIPIGAVLVHEGRIIARGHNCGAKFVKNGSTWTYSIYVDVNGDGVTNSDIKTGIDRRIAGPLPLDTHLAQRDRLCHAADAELAHHRPSFGAEDLRGEKQRQTVDELLPQCPCGDLATPLDEHAHDA